jgi:acetylornithine/succinyldiaminopimelate/putrescine aminotransferase
VALEVIHTLRDEGLVERSRDLGRTWLADLIALAPLYPGMREVRGRGLMVAVELHERIKAGLVFERMLDLGFLVGCSPAYNLIRFMPPLTISEQEIRRVTEGLEQVLTEIGRGYVEDARGRAIE